MGGKNGFLGAGGESGFLGTGLFSSGPQKLKGYGMDKDLAQAEKDVIKRQADIAAGRSPSIADLQFGQAMDRSLAQQQALAASQRGVSNAGLAMRQASQAGQQFQLENARDAAAAKLMEQRGADQMIAQMGATRRGVAMQADQQNIANRMAQQQQTQQFIGGAAASAAMLSDEDMKTNKQQSSGDSSKVISDFMDALKSYTYEYKQGAKQPGDKPTPKGEVKGVMAQDLEKTELGKQLVSDTEDGKVVDFAQGMAPLFAAIAELNKRTKKLEGK